MGPTRAPRGGVTPLEGARGEKIAFRLYLPEEGRAAQHPMWQSGNFAKTFTQCAKFRRTERAYVSRSGFWIFEA